MKDAYWFRHDSNARNDPKMSKLLMIGGQAAKGCFWDLIEIMRESTNYKINKADLDAISFQCRFPDGVIAQMIECDLIKEDETSLWSDSLMQRMERLESIREKRKMAGRIGGKKSSKSQADDKQMLSKCLSSDKQVLSKTKLEEKSREEKSRTDQIRVEHKREENSISPPKSPKGDGYIITAAEAKKLKAQKNTGYSQEFEQFWSAYPKKSGKKEADKAFRKAKKSADWPGLTDVIDAIGQQISSPQWQDKQYIPNPATWLNRGQWADETSVYGEGYQQLIDEIRDGTYDPSSGIPGF